MAFAWTVTKDNADKFQQNHVYAHGNHYFTMERDTILKQGQKFRILDSYNKLLIEGYAYSSDGFGGSEFNLPLESYREDETDTDTRILYYINGKWDEI